MPPIPLMFIAGGGPPTPSPTPTVTPTRTPSVTPSITVTPTVTPSNSPTPTPYQLWAWGPNNAGKLGINGYYSRSSPVQVGTTAVWSKISANYNTGLAIRTNNTLWSWGGNYQGQLGQGDLYARSSPTQVGSSTWKEIASGNVCTAISSSGTLWSWGHNVRGCLGLNENSYESAGRSTPTQVGNLSNWAKVSNGFFFCLATKTDGTLWSWGYNRFGSLGLGDYGFTSNVRSSPTQVGSNTNWSKISASGTQAGPGGWCVAIKTDGTLWSWGYNIRGQLGHGDTANRSSPTQVGDLNNWSIASAGSRHCAAIKTDGTLWTWGFNYWGQLGTDSRTNRYSPVQVGNLTTWSQVSCGAYTVLAVKTDGTLWAWGNNRFDLGRGSVGDNTGINRSSPVQIGALTSWSIPAGSGGTNGSFALRT